MPTWETIFAVTLAGLAFSSSPGPSMLFVLSRSIQFGQGAGIASSLGLAFGGCLLAALAALGMAELALRFPGVLTAARLFGACYLAFLSSQAFASLFGLSAANASIGQIRDQEEKPGRQKLTRFFLQGALVEFTNPKTLLFFLAFMTPFAAEHSKLGLLLLGSLIPATAVPADLVCIFLGALLAARIRGQRWLSKICDFLAAAVLLVLALATLTI